MLDLLTEIKYFNRESLKKKYQNYGNHYTLWWLFRVLIRKEKGWIEEFHEFVKEKNYASSTTCGPLAKVILDFFDFETGKKSLFNLKVCLFRGR